MRDRPFHIVTSWRIKGNLPDTARLLVGREDWPAWWGSTHRSVTLKDDGRCAIRSKGPLPLPLRGTARILARSAPNFCRIKAKGDVQGHSG